jgi:Zn-dependent peptidase ImmA (M78 family)
MKSNPVFIAKRLLTDLGLDDPCTIDIEDLIVYHNGMVKEVELMNCDGRMVMKHGRAIVSVNSAIEYPQKRRFILAHELGHILLHADQEASFMDDDSTLEAYKKGPQEVEANNFASELLMPGDLFRQYCFKKKFSPDLIQSLSLRFNTSLTSIIYRFIEYGNHPICVFYSKNGKIQYWKKSDDFNVWIPDKNKLDVPSDSVANEYYQFKRIYRKEDSVQEITKSTWFNLGKYDEDTSMNEYCIITPRYNTVLSVVWER